MSVAKHSWQGWWKRTDLVDVETRCVNCGLLLGSPYKEEPKMPARLMSTDGGKTWTKETRRGPCPGKMA